MKKVLLAGGAGLFRLCMALAILWTSSLLAPASFAQATSYTLTFVGLPEGSVPLSNYIGLDRKLKADVAGQRLNISVSPALTAPRRVRLSIVVSATGSSVTECNTEIATATTVSFDITGSGRDLVAADFTGSSGIGIQTSTENQPCIDALAKKITEGVAAIPTGIYRISAVLNDAATGTALGSGEHTIRIESASTTEAILNLTSPPNGDQVPQSASVVFNFDNSIPGTLFAFEHSTLTQSPEDATRDTSSSLRILRVPVGTRGSNQITAVYPSVAARPWTAGKKVSWLFIGQMPGSTEQRRSAVWSFTVVSSDPSFNQLANALSGAPDPVGSTYQNLLSSGHMLAYSSGNPIYRQEGDAGVKNPIDVSQFIALLADLAQRGVQLTTTVTSQ